MWLCVPTTDDAGLAARLSDHFGRAPFFTLVDGATGRTETVANPSAHHEHGACRPLDAFGAETPAVLLCRGIGRRALERWAALGTEIFLVDAPDVDAALRAFEKGRATPVTSATACRGGHYDVAGA